MKATLILIAFLAGANAMCPNLCSGHGHCGANDLCSCFANWQGNDCSGRTCNSAAAWVVGDRDFSFTSYQVVDNVGDDLIPSSHAYAECSNRGSCDRKTGECKCNTGFGGKGCRRMECPNACSGHGTCEYIEELVGISTYLGWDKGKIQGCKCDPGYEGHDCSARLCPKGDDPLTTSGANEVQSLTLDNGTSTTMSGTFTISYVDLYGGTWTTWPLSAKISGATLTHAATAKQVEEALEALPNRVVEDLTVSRAASNTNQGVVYTVTFLDATNSGNQNALIINTGACDTAGCQPHHAGVTVAGGTLTASVATVSGGTNDALVCSKRGDCDSSTGICECHSGYFGPACATQTAMI